MQCQQCLFAVKAQAKAALRNRERSHKDVLKTNLRYCHRTQLIKQHKKLMKKLGKKRVDNVPPILRTPLEVELSNDQSMQLTEVTEIILNEHHDDLETAFTSIGWIQSKLVPLLP